MTNVPIIPTDETTLEENSDVPTETCVPMETNVPTVLTDETTPEENSDLPVADNCPDITPQISPPSAAASPFFVLGTLSPGQGSQHKTPLRTAAGSEESRREQTCIVT